MHRRSLVLLTALALGGCANLAMLTQRPPPTLYGLTPKSTFAEDLPELDSRLIIEVPTAAAGLNSARIALKPEPTTIDYYANATWIEVLPLMVQALMIESFDNSGSLDVFSPDAVGVRAEYALRLHIREFQAEYDEGTNQPPLINARMQARLVHVPTRENLGGTSEQELVRASGTPVAEVVRGFDRALGETLKRLVEWTVRRIAEFEAEEGA